MFTKMARSRRQKEKEGMAFAEKGEKKKWTFAAKNRGTFGKKGDDLSLLSETQEKVSLAKTVSHRCRGGWGRKKEKASQSRTRLISESREKRFITKNTK